MPPSKGEDCMQVGTCAMCGKRSARYVCQECGLGVCEVCFEPQTWLCSDCYKSLKPQTQVLKNFGWPIPFKLFFLGLFLMLIGTIFVVITAILSGETATAGAVIFVGPIPIIVGTWPYSIWAIILAVALTILGIVMFIIWRKRMV